MPAARRLHRLPGYTGSDIMQAITQGGAPCPFLDRTEIGTHTCSVQARISMVSSTATGKQAAATRPPPSKPEPAVTRPVSGAF